MAQHKHFQQLVLSDVDGLQGQLDSKAGTGHDHDADYSASGHNHDASYATSGHNHDASYATSGHDHDADYATSGHNHDASYATSGHNHDASYATSGHTHSASLVPFSPQTFTDGTTITINASLGTYFRGSLGGNRTLGVPSNTTDGQRILVEALASGAQRTLTISGSIPVITGVTSPITIPSGKRWWGGLLVSSGTVYLIASAVQA